MARRLALIAVLLSVLAVPALARAGGITTPQGVSFGATPEQKPNTAPRPYFSYTLRPGGSAKDKLVVSNTGKKPLTLKLSAAYGTTATNSGSALTGAFVPCTGTACWITGLPSLVTLAGGAQRTVPFTVTVPAGTAASQYLAGISVEPAVVARPSAVAGSGQAGASAVVIPRVDVGVAVTVGSLAGLTSRLVITAVSSTSIGSMPRLLVHEHNTGQTFEQATGSTVCTAGNKVYRYTVQSRTILPGDTAVLDVNAPDLPVGKVVPCTVSLATSGQQASRAVFHTQVKIPATKPTKVIQTGPGSFSTVPVSSGTPTWAYILIGVGVAAVLLLLVLVVVLLRRPRSGTTA